MGASQMRQLGLTPCQGKRQLTQKKGQNIDWACAFSTYLTVNTANTSTTQVLDAPNASSAQQPLTVQGWEGTRFDLQKIVLAFWDMRLSRSTWDVGYASCCHLLDMVVLKNKCSGVFPKTFLPPLLTKLAENIFQWFLATDWPIKAPVNVSIEALR